MTNEEIVEMLQILLDNAKVGCADITVIHHVSFDSFKFVLEQTINALSQEPCDDAVSREAVKEIVNDIRDCISVEGYWAILERLKKLPSVNPQPCEDAISREELLKAIDTWDKFGCDADTKLVRYQDHYVPYIHYDDVIKCIKGMPSVTQKSGKWIYRRGDKYSCSKCSTTTSVDEAGIDEKPMYKFCPYCGAKMENRQIQGGIKHDRL